MNKLNERLTTMIVVFLVGMVLVFGLGLFVHIAYNLRRLEARSERMLQDNPALTSFFGD